MRRARLLALTMLLCFLCACGAAEAKVDEAAEIRAKMLEADGFSFTAGLRCDYGDRVWDCALDFVGGADSALITVLEPEIIAGLQIGVENGLATLRYAGAALDTGDIFGDGASAAEVLPLLLKSLREGYVSECYGEKVDGLECTVLVLEAGTDRTVAVWFDGDHTPQKAELREKGKTVVFCTFEGFTYN